ncbi:MAG: MBL fold metallo-hydrolase [Anaerolineae bacterium]
MTDPSYHFTLGQFEILVMKAGGNPRAATAFLPDAPPDELIPIVRRFNINPDEMAWSMNVVLVKTGTHTVLIDTGLPTSSVDQKLAAEGVTAGEVDTIIITHGHGDHVGGILNATGEFVYPNARYIFWKSEWDYWTADGRFAEGDSNPTRAIWQALKANPQRVTVIGGDTQEVDVLPGIRAIATPGHTIGHIALLLESNGQKLLHIADAAHQPFQMACPQWSPGFDFDKSLSPDSRRLVFERAAQEKALLLAYHFAFPGIGRVVQHNDGLAWEVVGGAR